MKSFPTVILLLTALWIASIFLVCFINAQYSRECMARGGLPSTSVYSANTCALGKD